MAFIRKNKYLVRVILAAYNGSQYIDEQIASILAQQDVDVELYISIDLSSDNTLAICRNYQKIHPNIFLLPYGKHFGSAAKNFFELIREVPVSDSDFFALSDQDDIWLPKKLKWAIACMELNKVNGYSSNAIAFWPDKTSFITNKTQRMKKYDHLFEAAGPGCTYVLSADGMLLLQHFIKTNNVEISKVWSHDWLIYAFFRHNNLGWYLDSNSYILYRQHRHNQIGINRGLRAYLWRLKYLMNGKYFYQHKIVAGLLQAPALSKLDVIKNGFQTRRKMREAVILIIFFVLNFKNNGR